jgi:hypothetical protein
MKRFSPLFRLFAKSLKSLFRREVEGRGGGVGGRLQGCRVIRFGILRNYVDRNYVDRNYIDRNYVDDDPDRGR